jgi:PTS system nitrogen regulatory IIA component
MNEYQITFLVEDINASSRVAKTLHRLAKKLKSTLCIINITRKRKAALSKSVAMLQAGLVKGDLCQIIVVGIDAELACFVIKSIIAEHYILIGTNINYLFSNQFSNRLPEVSLPSKVQWHYAKAHTELEKFECLNGLAQLIYPEHLEKLVLAFIKREECSSTCIAPGIALPHVMLDGIDQITVAVISSNTPIDWKSKMGDVFLVIALVIPTEPTREQIINATNLTRNLLSSQVVERLLMTKNSVDLQALLMYFMSRLLP